MARLEPGGLYLMFDNNFIIKRTNDLKKETITKLRSSVRFDFPMKSVEADNLYTLSFEPDIVESLQEGTAYLSKNKDGVVGVVARNKSGQIIGHGKLQPVEINEVVKDLQPNKSPCYRLDLAQLGNLLMQISIQETLTEIVDYLYILDKQIAHLAEGINNNRLARVDTAENLLNQALNTSNMDLKFKLLTDAITEALNGRDSLIREVVRNLQQLQTITNEIHKNGPGLKNLIRKPLASVNSIQQKISEIELNYQGIIRASGIISLAYEELQEYGPLKVSLEPCIDFMESLEKHKSMIAGWLPPSSDKNRQDFWLKDIKKQKERMVAYLQQVNLPNREICIEVTGDDLKKLVEGYEDESL